MSAKTSATALSVDGVGAEPKLSSILSELFKARLTFLVLLTTLVGFYLGSSEPLDFVLLTHTLGGTAFLAAGASALNQLMEREYDARMRRTQGRPLPAGHLTPDAVLLIGVGLAVAGLAWLSWGVNLLAAVIGAATVASYLFVYTPLKRLTVLNTIVGAVPGALPPLIGWAAATGELGAQGWALFAIVFFWQLPHFMAISWLYREEYSRAGFRMLSGQDPDGRRTAASAIRNTIGLVAISLFPFVQRTSGVVYLVVAAVIGFIFLGCAIQFARSLTAQSARRLFFASILYLPLLLGALVFDKSKKLTPPGITSDKIGGRFSPREESIAVPLVGTKPVQFVN
jgi:protoheme IX farnesyltransferase